jgi:hypothetical protein
MRVRTSRRRRISRGWILAKICKGDVDDQLNELAVDEVRRLRFPPADELGIVPMSCVSIALICWCVAASCSGNAVSRSARIRPAHLPFQCPHLLADRRLGAVRLPCGRAERPRCGDGREHHGWLVSSAFAPCA